MNVIKGWLLGLMALLSSCASDRWLIPDSPHTRMALANEVPVVEGVTFAVERGRIYLPVKEVEALVGKVRLPEKTKRQLTDGSPLVSLKALEAAGCQVQRGDDGRSALIRKRWKFFRVSVGKKRAEVNLSKQRLFAWQGKRLVLSSRISSGKRGRTPTGRFRAGPYKARRHFSSLYDNAPMPWSVQVTGHVFIHGYTSVPNYPASHGCIRVPLNEGNPAKFFYEWIDRGTPIHVRR